MNKKAFLNQLRKKLRGLPQDEIENTIRYYEEYISDAGTGNEQRVISELGSPSAVASRVIGELAASGKGKSRRPVSFWVILLAILASPIALPVSLVVAVAAIVLIVVTAAVLLSIFAAGVAAVAGGLFAIFAGVLGMAGSTATGVFFIGFSLVSIAVGTAVAAGTVELSKVAFRGLKKLLAKFLIRRGQK